MECCICLQDSKKWFYAPCNHQWCRKCHRQMQRYDMTTCPLCRASWWTRLPNLYIESLLDGYEPVMRWRVKRHRRRERRASYQRI